MRCRNCHTALMDTDLVCPSCRTSRARATAAAPEPTGNPPNNLLMLLPIFGGALGGVVYAGLTAAQASASTGGPPQLGGTRAASSFSLKRPLGVLLLLVGGLFLVLAVVHAADTWNIARRQPTVVTGAELCRKGYLQSAPDWIAYTFAEAKPIEVAVTRQRLGRGGDVEAYCLLVRAGDKWLMATVAPGFEGNELVGRLVPFDTPASQALPGPLRQLLPNKAALLPFELNAVDGSASDQHIRYAAAGWLAVFGLLGLWLGWRLARRRPVPSPALSLAAERHLGTAFSSGRR